MSAKRIPFEPEDERHIASAATWAMVSAVVSIASTAVGAFITFGAVSSAGIGNLIGEIFTVVITVILAAWLFRAGAAFRALAVTDGADQRHLLVGFARLRAYFRLIVSLALGAALVTIALVVLGGTAALGI